MLTFILGAATVFSSCSKDDDNATSSPSGNVTVSYTKGSKIQARYKYSVSVKYSGNASDVKVIGIRWGKGNAIRYTSSNTAQSKTFSKTIELYDGDHYTIEGFVKLNSGKTITSKSVRVTP